MVSTIVGTVTIYGPRWHTVTYETAAWHSEVELTPGTYELKAYRFSGRVELSAEIPGRYISLYLPALLGGVAVGSQPQGRQHRDVGKPTSVVLRFGHNAPEVSLKPGLLSVHVWDASRGHREGGGIDLYELQTLQFRQDVRVGSYFHVNAEPLCWVTEQPHKLAEILNPLAAKGEFPEVFRVSGWHGPEKFGRSEIKTHLSPFTDHLPTAAEALQRMYDFRDAEKERKSA